MLSKPVLKSHWSIRNTGSCYLLLSEDDRYLLQDAIYDHLMPLLDGRNTVADMVHRLKGRVSAAAIRSALDSMARQGFLTESPARQWTPADAFWELAGSAASDVHCRVPTASAAVMASDTNVGESIGRALSLLDILVTSDARFASWRSRRSWSAGRPRTTPQSIHFDVTVARGTSSRRYVLARTAAPASGCDRRAWP